MARQYFEAEVPDGYRLGAADGEDDAYRGLLFDAENKLAGHAKFRPVDDPGPDTYDSWQPTSPTSPGGGSELDDETREQLEALGTVLAAMLIYAIKVAAGPRLPISCDGGTTRSWRPSPTRSTSSVQRGTASSTLRSRP